MAEVSFETLKPYLDKYRAYLKELGRKDGDILSNANEDYKKEIPDRANQLLKSEEWNEEIIENGVIKNALIEIIQPKISINLLSYYSINEFKNTLEEKGEEAERLLFELFHERKDKESFERICKMFGRKYGLISYLYFVHDPEKYLPLRPSFFDRAFKILGIQHQLSGKCGWDNYQGFLEIMTEIRNIMKDYFSLEHVDLLDAHSFVWVVQYMLGPAPESVIHKEYGIGVIENTKNDKIYVVFSGKKRIFRRQEAYENGYITNYDRDEDNY